jgi:uncharacterized Zn finger protein (UPF0148 family)
MTKTWIDKGCPRCGGSIVEEDGVFFCVEPGICTWYTDDSEEVSNNE